MDTLSVPFQNRPLPNAREYLSCHDLTDSLDHILYYFILPIRKEGRILFICGLEHAEGRVNREIDYEDILHMYTITG